jgi:hypothetical protein
VARGNRGRQARIHSTADIWQGRQPATHPPEETTELVARVAALRKAEPTLSLWGAIRRLTPDPAWAAKLEPVVHRGPPEN